LVFIDDFIGTGESASGHLQEINTMLRGVLADRNIKTFLWLLQFFVMDGNMLRRLERA
jgi:hypothetical protein